MEIKLNVGCSDDMKPGYINIDQHSDSPRQTPFTHYAAAYLINEVVNGNTVYRDDYTYTHDLAQRYPLPDSFVDAIYAKDVFEHISSAKFPGNRGKIWAMNESYRVLKPGGVLELFVPCVHMRDMTINLGAFADPTHASFWTYDDRYYFTEEWNNPQGERGRLGPAYGITCRFDIVKWELVEYGAPHERRSKIHAVLRAVK
jgi:SAM-dependent methyltransferase